MSFVFLIVFSHFESNRPGLAIIICPGDRAILRTLTRAALGVRHANGAQIEYVRQVARLKTEGVPVGDKYHTGHHYRDVVYLATRALQRHQACDYRTPLGSLGIPSNYAVLFDSIPLGGVTAGGRHGGVTVICLNAVSSRTSRLHSKLVAWCQHKGGHSGAAIAADVFDALSAEPLEFSPREQQGMMSGIGGDGACVSGGPSRIKRGTGAAEHLWEIVHPQITAPLEEHLADLIPQTRGARRIADPSLHET